MTEATTERPGRTVTGPTTVDKEVTREVTTDSEESDESCHRSHSEISRLVKYNQ